MRLVVDGLGYPIVVSDRAPAEVAQIVLRRALRPLVVVDRNVAGRGEVIAASLRSAGCEPLGTFAIDAGERRKRWKTVEDLHGMFVAAGADRHAVVVAVGGGTLTDCAGFAAATFMRGVSWLAVATTTLGMVDAAIGGKTGVDRPDGKNLVGAFWQPDGVVADLEALSSLPARLRRDGIAEAVKAAIVGDPGLLDDIERHDIGAPPAGWARIVARAAAVKARIVASDPADRGGRAALNLGHTFAHAIELASRYRTGHGAAVALGLRSAGVLGRSRTRWSHEEHRRVLGALQRHGLRVRAPRLAPDDVLVAMASDKKRRDGAVRFVLPVRLGEVQAGVEVPEAGVREALETLRVAPGRGAW